MSRKKSSLKRKAVLSFLMGIFILSGCGLSGDPPASPVDHSMNEGSDTNAAEPDNKAKDNGKEQTKEQTKDQTKDRTQEYETSEELPKPLEVPVNTKGEDIHYYSEDGIQLGRAIHCCKADGENIYLAYGDLGLYVMPIGAGEQSPVELDNPEGLDVSNVAIDAYGRLHLLMVNKDRDEWFIWRLDGDYRIDKIIDISPWYGTKHTPLWFLIDKEGNYFFQWILDRNGVLADKEGGFQFKLSMEELEIDWIYEAAVGKDGEIYLVYHGGDDKLKIGKLDVENGAIDKETSSLDFPDNENFTAMFSGTDTNLLLFSPYSGVWAYDNEAGVMENRVPLSDMKFDTATESWPLTFLPDGRLLLLGQKENNPPDDVDLFLKYIPAGR